MGARRRRARAHCRRDVSLPPAEPVGRGARRAELRRLPARGTAAAVRQARKTWGPQGLAAARKAWKLDLVYPAFYGLLGALLASLAATYAEWGWLATAMAVVSWLSISAGAVDLLIENPAVAVGLWGTPSEAAARVARIAGLLKRLLIGIVLVSLLGGLVAVLASRA